MKKSKRLQQPELGPAGVRVIAGQSIGSGKAAPQAAPRKFVWWPWAAAAASLLLAFAIYGPALNGPFVLDDLYLRYANPQIVNATFRQWIADSRPMLMASFWLNHELTGDDPFGFHATNVVCIFSYR